MNNILQRAITGLCFIIVLIGSIVFSPFTYVFLFSIVVFLGLREFYTLINNSGVKLESRVGIISGVLCFLITFLNANSAYPNKYFFFLIAYFFLVFIRELFRVSEKPFTNIALTFAGLMFVAVPFSLMNYLAFTAFDGGYNWHPVLGFFILLWTSDTGAYLAGSSMGKTKLFERISPKKTWEGSVGGLIATVGVAFLLSYFYQDISLIHWIVIGIIIVVFGTLGDLIESMLKRSLNIKDSGTILPGHGGILDRFDGLLIAMPFVVLYYKFIVCS